MDIIAPGQMAEHYGKIVDLDKQIATEYAEGYDVDTHLEDRRELQAEWDRAKKLASD